MSQTTALFKKYPASAQDIKILCNLFDLHNIARIDSDNQHNANCVVIRQKENGVYAYSLIVSSTPLGCENYSSLSSFYERFLHTLKSISVCKLDDAEYTCEYHDECVVVNGTRVSKTRISDMLAAFNIRSDGKLLYYIICKDIKFTYDLLVHITSNPLFTK